MEETKSKKSMPMIVTFFVIVLVLIVGYVVYANNSNQNDEAMTEMMTDITPTNAVMIEEAGDLMDGEGVMEEEAMMEVMSVDVEGGSFYYEPNEIRVKKGQNVQITLTAVDMMHDFVLDEFDVQSEIIEEGETTTFEFTPDKTGEFEFYCSVGEHRANGMVGTLIVE